MSETLTVAVPDLGNVNQAEVIEILVKIGDKIAQEDTVVTLESDKASMDIPSTAAGIVRDILVKVGDKIGTGKPLVTLESASDKTVEKKTDAKPAEEKVAAATVSSTTAVTIEKSSPEKIAAPEKIADSDFADAHAGPAVRRLARELGVDLTRIAGSGPHERILKSDVHAFVKRALQGGAGVSLPTPPQIDFSKFGDIEERTLSKIKKLTGQNVQQSSMTIPHVTQFDEADITELEAFRLANKKLAEDHKVKLTPLVFIMKAVVACLQALPLFNSSLNATGDALIMKKYFHLGVAVDTPDGLVVPVIRDVDKKGMLQLAAELAMISEKARNKKLLPNDMQGSCFTISSLGGIGGVAFTPIINAPDVAILGVSKAQQKPVFQDGEWLPRLMLPLSLSYDHRVIDGADGARFTALLASHLADIRKLLL